jgi:hypothetical protein
MADEQDRAETVDDEVIGGEYPPDTLLGAQAYGAAGAEPHAVESVAARAAKEEPEQLPEPTGIPADDDLVDDVVQEREAPIPAEEAAVHVIDEELGGFDSTVDDPALAAANELDPEVER